MKNFPFIFHLYSPPFPSSRIEGFGGDFFFPVYCCTSIICSQTVILISYTLYLLLFYIFMCYGIFITVDRTKARMVITSINLSLVVVDAKWSCVGLYIFFKWMQQKIWKINFRYTCNVYTEKMVTKKQQR